MKIKNKLPAPVQEKIVSILTSVAIFCYMQKLAYLHIVLPYHMQNDFAEPWLISIIIGIIVIIMHQTITRIVKKSFFHFDNQYEKKTTDAFDDFIKKRLEVMHFSIMEIEDECSKATKNLKKLGILLNEIQGTNIALTKKNIGKLCRKEQVQSPNEKYTYYLLETLKMIEIKKKLHNEMRLQKEDFTSYKKRAKSFLEASKKMPLEKLAKNFEDILI